MIRAQLLVFNRHAGQQEPILIHSSPNSLDSSLWSFHVRYLKLFTCFSCFSNTHHTDVLPFRAHTTHWKDIDRYRCSLPAASAPTPSRPTNFAFDLAFPLEDFQGFCAWRIFTIPQEALAILCGTAYTNYDGCT